MNHRALSQLVTIAGLGTLTACVAEVDVVSDETQETIANLIQAGFPEDDIMVVDDIVYVGRDSVVSLEASREMIDSDGAVSTEHYRTKNLVSPSLKMICIDGQRFVGPFGDALDMAIQNYNELGLTFSMKRIDFFSNSGCDAVITAKVGHGVGGLAGFPSGGRPYGEIIIGAGLWLYDVNTIEHVITHELGHAVGLRHTDFYNRSISCGTGGNEGQDPVGAIHIPGTPTDATVGGSIMNSCFRDVETGEFTSSDRVALRTLY